MDDKIALPLLQLDVISDLICPWCYIGKRNLDRALVQIKDFRINLIWRPFQLYPKARPKAHDRNKQIIQKILAAAKDTGIDFAFEKMTGTPNTLDAHRLIRWAGSTGVQHQVVESLFRGHFEQGRDIGEPAVLLDIAAAHHMDTKLLAGLFDSDTDIADTRTDDAAARDLGVTGVPGFLAGGKILLLGAQEPAYLLKFLTRAQERLTAEAQEAETAANSTS